MYMIKVVFLGSRPKDLFYIANSASYCDGQQGTCKCSATTERCTGQDLCSKNGTCEGKVKKSQFEYSNMPNICLHP